MSLSTNAIPDDFPHFAAWYGQIPDFGYLSTSDYHRKRYNCKDHWFKMRQVVDTRYYMHWQYADSQSYTATAYMETIQDLMRCRKIGKLPAEDRPGEYRKWFLEKREVNDVWEYRDMPQILGRWKVSQQVMV